MKLSSQGSVTQSHRRLRDQKTAQNSKFGYVRIYKPKQVTSYLAEESSAFLPSADTADQCKHKPINTLWASKYSLGWGKVLQPVGREAFSTETAFFAAGRSQT